MSLALGQAGTLDTTFDGDGIVVTAIGTEQDYLLCMAVQPDGKILVGGESHASGGGTDMVVVRYTGNGALDPSFDGDGKLSLDQGFLEGVSGILVQPDGRIILSATVDMQFALIRLNSDGSLDTGLDGDGVVFTGFTGAAEARAADVALQPDGKILLSGRVSGTTTLYDMAMTRYAPDGTPDPTFGVNGKVVTELGYDLDHGQRMQLQPDGKILLGGITGTWLATDMAVLRYEADGTLDPTFGIGGVATVDVGDDETPTDMALAPDGRIVMSGYIWGGGSIDIVVAQFLTDGSLDASFDTDGIVITDIASANDHGQGLAIQPDGKILVCGYTTVGADDDFALLRYEMNGDLDAGFGGDGIVVTPYTPGQHRGWVMLQQADGRILVGGMADNGSDDDLAVLRYNNGEPVSVPEGSSVIGAWIYPDPVDDEARLHFRMVKGQAVQCHLIDAQGRTVRTLLPDAFRSAGDHEVVLDLGGITAGYYTVQVSCTSERAAVPLVKR